MEEIIINHKNDISKYDNADLYSYICDLEEKNKQLKDKLDKIKEYIENTPNFITFKDSYLAKQFLSIIESSDK